MRRRRRLPRRIYPPDTRYIHDYLNRLPFDNENELKTLIIIFCVALCSFYYYIRFQLS
jgi:hypothetical protein